ncbi:class I SAM-dependent methyltransferase [Labrys wisconsinensis]|uniref:SAM-dependent methyltransferase n=1 Tax=Labrys wisconsinensis TaxID=425677 RepID=A0ABU0J4Y8_9HYPH|nr:class I SAM-dependent methyltransferase [Labrys wisconsinensis]MDQ0469323.1 SAM-dependent methyltransferase [Labrys wisconsinensis]
MHETGPFDDRLYADPALVDFYDLDNGWRADFDFCATLAAGAGSVLDLGCGTGELAAALAPGRHVAGVDPAAAMLEAARRRPGGERVRWIEADARTVRLGHRFDRVILTGHAFQVFLTTADQRAVLRTIAEHLAPDGRFVFDSRNPQARAWLEWVPGESHRRLDHPALGPVEAWNDAVHDAATGIVTYETHYRLLRDGRHLCAASRIRFTPQADLAALLDEAGLVVETWLGDWHGGACGPSSPDFIPIGRRR